MIADHSYLEAWARDAEGVRLFRFDRIVDAAVRDEPAAPPELPGDTDTSLFEADPAGGDTAAGTGLGLDARVLPDAGAHRSARRIL